MFNLNLGSNERVVVIIRKHWLPFAFQLLALLFAAVFPPALVAFVPQEILLLMLPAFTDKMVVFGYSFWLLIVWILVFVAWTIYFLDVWVVTSERIIDIDQESLFHHKVVTARLEKIQDAHVEVNGVFATFFGFGTLTFYTAGENPDIVIENAAHPYAAKEKLLAAIGKKEDTKTNGKAAP